MAKPKKEQKEMLDWFLNIFGAKELRYLPDNVLANVLANNTAIYDEYIKKYPDLEKDSLREFFEFYLSDKKFLAQDFTPDSVAQLLAEINAITAKREILDECAGIGSLIIPYWKTYHDVIVWAREKSVTTIPFLLFNLAVRNMQGVVIQGDTLTLESDKVYLLSKGDQFSHVQEFNVKEAIRHTDPVYLIKALMAWR